MTIVITGGEGFVGRHLQAELRRAWPEVKIIVWDKPEVDITDPDTYRQELSDAAPAWVVHLAAIAAVGESWQNPALLRQVNVEGTKTLLETIAAKSPATKVLAVSSADIYGAAATTTPPPSPRLRRAGLPELSLAEAKPVNPYGESKRDMEAVIEAEHNGRCIRVRPFPHIGPGQQRGFVAADFAAQLVKIEKSAASHEALKERSGTPRQQRTAGTIKVGNLNAVRDFTDVRDVVRAYRLLMESGEVGEVYHVASGRGVSIQQLLDALLALTTATVRVEQDPERLRPSDTPVLIGNAEKIKAATGWQPTIPLEQSLRDVLDDWRGRLVIGNS